MSKVVIIDYGLSNLKSVKRAFEHCGADAIITSERSKILNADKIVLPGVGAFKDGMEGLEELQLIEPIKEQVKKGVPLLGICLGMQMLLDESDENGVYKGLGLIPGRVERIPDKDVDGKKQCVPHISWEKLYIPSWKKEFTHKIISSNRVNGEAYFIHSYEAICRDISDCIAVAHYGGREVSGVITRENIIGTQFHPEKSGEMGLKLIKNFIEL